MLNVAMNRFYKIHICCQKNSPGDRYTNKKIGGSPSSWRVSILFHLNSISNHFHFKIDCLHAFILINFKCVFGSILFAFWNFCWQFR